MTPPEPSVPDLPEPLLRFAELFSRHDFWESHEALEGPWRERGSRFYQGLILLASAFVHVQRDNTHGIAAQLRKAEDALRPFAPCYLGIDVDRLLTEARSLRKVADSEIRPQGDRQAWSTLVRYPSLELDAARIRGDEPELEL